MEVTTEHQLHHERKLSERSSVGSDGAYATRQSRMEISEVPLLPQVLGHKALTVWPLK